MQMLVVFSIGLGLIGSPAPQRRQPAPRSGRSTTDVTAIARPTQQAGISAGRTTDATPQGPSAAPGSGTVRSNEQPEPLSVSSKRNDAVLVATKGRALRRANAEAALARGQMDLRVGRFAAAVVAFSRALRLGADPVTVRHWRGVALAEQGRIADAERDLAFVATRRPHDRDLAMQLGRVLLAEGKFMWAMRRLQSVVRADPHRAKAWMLLGYCLMRLEEYDDAVDVLRRARRLARSKRLRARTGVLLGIVRLHQGKVARSVVLMTRSARASGLAVGSVTDLLRVRLAGNPGRWGASVSLGSGFDSNPAMGPDLVPGWARSSEGAADVALSVSGWYRPLDRHGHSLRGGLSLQRHFYVPPKGRGAEALVSAFSMTVLSADSTYQYQYLSSDGLDGIQAGYRFSLVELDGGSSMPGEPEPFLYSENHSMELAWQRTMKNGDISVTVQPGYGAYRDRDRDGFWGQADCAVSHFYLGRKLRLYVRLGFNLHDARWKAWRWAGVGAWSAVSWFAPGSLDVVGWASYDFHRHFDSAGALTSGELNQWELAPGAMRQDHLLTLTAGIGRRLDRKGRWRLDLSVRYLKSWSTAGFFAYSRFMGLVAVTGAFGSDRRGS